MRLIQLTPAAERLSPHVRHFGEHVDARPNIFAAFGVVGGGREERIRPGIGGEAIDFMELIDGCSEPRGIASDIV